MQTPTLIIRNCPSENHALASFRLAEDFDATHRDVGRMGGLIYHVEFANKKTDAAYVYRTKRGITIQWQ